MNLDELIEICKVYNNLEHAIQEQVEVVATQSVTDSNFNFNAVKYIREFLEEVWNLGDRELEPQVEEALTYLDNWERGAARHG